MFISYAQNFEDVILWRAFKNIPHGLYVDIGAQDPIVDSVSYAFYQFGWRGLNVEPTNQYATRFRELRPDDVLIQQAVSDTEGSIAFYEVTDTGLSTADSEIASGYEEAGRKVTRREVACVPLSAVFDQVAGRDIHWLKIDVEGMEQAVINSWGSHPQRPWIVVAESTRPNTDEPWFEHWEPELLDRGYAFCYSDGLNRFYVHEAHPELKTHLLAPPNVFDDFTLTDASYFVRHPQQQLVQTRAELAEATGGDAVVARILEEQREEIKRLQTSNLVLNERLLLATQAAQVEAQHIHNQQTSALQGRVDTLISAVEQLQLTSKASESATRALKTLNRKEVERREALEQQLSDLQAQADASQSDRLQSAREQLAVREKSVQMAQRIAELEASEAALNSGLHESRTQAQKLDHENAGLRQIRDSSTWKMTYPIRRAMHVLRVNGQDAQNGNVANAAASAIEQLLPISSYADCQQIDQWEILLGNSVGEAKSSGSRN